MFQAGMIAARRRLVSHRCLASNMTCSPNPPVLPDERTDQDFSGTLSRRLNLASSPNLPPLPDERTAEVSGRVFASNLTPNPTLPLLQTGKTVKATSGTLPRPAQPPGLSAQGRGFASLSRLPTNGWRRTDVTGASLLVPQVNRKFCTLPGDSSARNTGDDTGNGMPKSERLLRRIKDQLEDMTRTVLSFEELYNKEIKPLLVSRCLIVPGGMNLKSRAFLHSQTFKIANHNASYISCFDVTAYKKFCDDDKKWGSFLSFLVEKRIFVIEDWDKSFSTIETLMYDHGLKQPDDGTEEPFYKGECDASFDEATKTANLAYIIWKDNKVTHAEVFSSLKCSSAVEAEIYAAMALLYKAEELKIHKLQLWCDSRTVTKILTGELSVDKKHQQRDFFLMLRAMGARFKSLVVSWKPRELMVFVDDLAKAANSPDFDLFTALKRSLDKFDSHLRGSPIFRIERTKLTTTAVKKFGDVHFDESFGSGGKSRYIIEVEEHLKFDCLVGLNQSLEPSEIELFTGHRGEDKIDFLKRQLELLDPGADMLMNPTGACSRIVHKEAGSPYKKLVVVYDYSVPKEMYYTPGEFHVVMITPSERESMREEIENLTALGFIYFNGVRFPLNKEKEKNEDK